MRYLNTPESGNPSVISQDFAPLKMDILCCHYWWLKVWKNSNLSFPYWRIYHNNKAGASITFEGNTWGLTAGKIAIIAPNTPFSTNYDPDNKVPQRDDFLIGGPYRTIEEKDLDDDGLIEHLYVHFNLSPPYDRVSPGIYIVDADLYLRNRIEQLSDFSKDNPKHFGRVKNLLLNTIITELLFAIPDDEWATSSSDERVKSTIKHVDLNLVDKLSNESLAKRINMATNSFARLFKTETGTALQQYVLTRRVDKACMMLHHSNASIEEIAEECGFCDRYHFSRMFKKIARKSPADYRSSYNYF